ncbi:MAG: hypothetical protein EB127_22470 [Alphaproteobacteria bacterium]|nr:hypothetical protein [Alphaproteobacteria bacterium]
MGARINYVFKDKETAIGEPSSSVVLYSHWGETGWMSDIAGALAHAKPRWGDHAYCTRMIISYLIADSIMDERGFGIYSITGDNYEFLDTTVVIDLVKQTIHIPHEVKWESFIDAINSLDNGMENLIQ